MRCGGIWNAMNMRQRMDDPEVGRVCLPSSPLRFTDAPALKPSPFLNQHEEEVLGGCLGFRRNNARRCGKRERNPLSALGQRPCYADARNIAAEMSPEIAACGGT
jgi:hypothetical protein